MPRRSPRWSAAMTEAILRQSPAEVQALINKGMDPTSLCPPMGQPALMLAVAGGDVGTVEVLLDAGANPNTSWNGDHVLHLACRLGHTGVANILLDKGVDIEVASGDQCRPLFITAEHGRTETAKLLIERGAQLEWMREEAYTALYMACQCGNFGVVKLLLAAGAYIGRQGKHGFTPLIQSAHRGHLKMVQALLKQGSPPDTRNNQGCTALHLASSSGQVAVVKELLEAGSNATLAEPNGFTAWDLAKQEGHPAVQAVLLQYGGDGRPPPAGMTELHAAADVGDVVGIRNLVQAGAAINVRDGEGVTPLQRAVMSMSPKCVSVLLSAGADDKMLFPPGYGKNTTPLDFSYMAGLSTWNYCSQNGIRDMTVMTTIVQLRHVLMRAGAFRGPWRWPAGATSTRVRAEEQGGDKDNKERVGAGVLTTTRRIKMIVVVRPGRPRVSRSGPLLWRAMDRYSGKGKSPGDEPT